MGDIHTKKKSGIPIEKYEPPKGINSAKKKITITTMCNDCLTNYEDKIGTVYFIVDPEEDCECTSYIKCGTCKLIERGILTDTE